MMVEMLNDQIFKNLKDAAYDLRFLLDRGYSKKQALEFVSTRYSLSKKWRLLLYRCIFSKKECKMHKQKRVNVQKILGKRVYVDGYNVLITVESLLLKDPIYLCDDGFVRDIRCIFGKYKFSEITGQALELIIKELSKLAPSEIFFFYDKPVSYSGELCKMTRNLLEKHFNFGSAETINNVDTSLVRFKEHIICTSDVFIIDNVDFVFDLPAYIAKQHGIQLLKL